MALTKKSGWKNLFLTQKICAPETAQIFIHFHAMKKVHKSLFWAIVGLFAVTFPFGVDAQDDLYYDPATDTPVSTQATRTEEYNDDNNVTHRYHDEDDGYYEDDDDYAYEYSSRIRRFHRPSVVVDYYDPFYVDLYNYDPYYSPGTSIYVYNYNDYWSYRRWRRWHRWNTWNNWDYGYNYGWNNWGWNSCYSYNSPWYNPWVVNNYYYDPYWTWNGYNPYYHDSYYGNNWVNNHYYYNNNGSNGNGYSPQTYTGPRRGGSHVNPGYARIQDNKGRLATTQTNVPMIEKSTPRPGRTVGDMESTPMTGRGKAATDRNNSAPNTGGRRPEGNTVDPVTRTPRTPATEPTKGRDTETPSRRNNDGYTPRRSEDTKPAPRTETPTRRGNDEGGYSPRPSRTETPSRGNDNEGYSPRRSESTPSRNEESRPTRRAEERTYERPTRSSNNNNNNNSGGGGFQESRPTRSSDSGSSMRSSGGNSSRSSNSDSGSSRSSGGNSSSNNSSSRSSGGGGRGGRG